MSRGHNKKNRKSNYGRVPRDNQYYSRTDVLRDPIKTLENDFFRQEFNRQSHLDSILDPPGEDLRRWRPKKRDALYNEIDRGEDNSFGNPTVSIQQKSDPVSRFTGFASSLRAHL